MKYGVLVKSRPMCAVLSRAVIGSTDQYNRGIWITPADLPSIREYFVAHGHKYGADYWCNGTNQHNQVFMSQFEKLWA